MTKLDRGSSRTPHEASIGELIERRLSRRGALLGLAGAARGGGLRRRRRQQAQKSGPSSFTFTEVPHVNDPTHHVPDDYEVQILIRWGDPVLPGAPAFDPDNQTAAAQAKQFGYNNDFLGLHPLPPAARRATAS